MSPLVIGAIGVVVVLIIVIIIVMATRQDQPQVVGTIPVIGASGQVQQAPVVAVPVSKWEAVKQNKWGSKLDWAAAIYDATVGAPIGTRKPPYEGGVHHQVNAGFMPAGDVLSKSNADGLCDNPCAWYKDKATAAGLCECIPGAARAINF